MKYTFYNSLTGEITGVISSDNEELLSLNTAGKNYISGDYDSKMFYISNSEPVSKPADPSSLLNPYVFDYNNKAWKLDLEKCTRLTRHYRNQLLSTIDRVNPVWYASLTSQQQTELAAYRQALLDVPQQAGWPESVTWPQQPTWL
jgi:hypothetical protein